MEQQVYTHACWRVRAGREAAFVTAWNRLAETFSGMEKPPLWGTLLRSATDPRPFYSFGPWRSVADVERMRKSEPVQAAMAALRQLCVEATPGLYHVVRHVAVAAGQRDA